MINIGAVISGRYEIIEKIGTGGMADVYRAKDHRLNRYVAVKILKNEYSEDAKFVTKFRQEAQAIACLSHPNIVGVYDVGMLADEKLQITLAISLHAPNDEIRRQTMPIANRYTIGEIIQACKYYFDKTGRRITFEYSMIRGVNDKKEHAKELAGRLSGLNCHINLIPLNEVKERNCYRSTKEDIEKFKSILEKYRKTVTIRREMGSDIDAACGQLRKKFLTKNGRN